MTEKWINNYNLAKEYYMHNGNLNVPLNFTTVNGYSFDKKGIKLGIWVANQKLKFQKDQESLSSQQIDLLSNIGMNTVPEKKIDNHIDNYKTYKKLLLLLEKNVRLKKVINEDEMNDFVQKLVTDKIDDSQIEFLYNYLYQRNSINKINLTYLNKQIHMLEYNLDDSIFYSIISKNNNIGDIKRKSVVIYNKKKEKDSKKLVAYSLDSAIDLVILSTKIREYDPDTSISKIIEEGLRRTDYERVSTLSSKGFNVYDTYEGKEHFMSSFKDNYFDKLNDIEKQNDNINRTKYTAKALKYVKRLESSLNMSNELKHLDDRYNYDIDTLTDDYDIDSYMENLDSYSEEVNKSKKR